MNCNDFLAALETGGPLQRRRARRHAAGCPRCAAVAARLDAVKRQWADVPTLTDRERSLWKQAAVAAEEPGLRSITLPARQRRPSLRDGWQWWAAAACVLLVVSLAVTIVVRHQTVEVVGGQQPVPPTTNRTTVPPTPPTAGPVRIEPVDGAGELQHLATAVDRLDDQMKELGRKAERAEARSQVALALDRFGHW